MNPGILTTQRPDREAVAAVAAPQRRVPHRPSPVDGVADGTGASYDLGEIAAELGRSALLSLFVHDGQFYGVSIVDQRIQLSSLGAESEVSTEVDKLSYALAKRAHGMSPQADAVFAGCALRAAQVIQRRLLAPVRAALQEGRPLVVVPAGRLHALAWAELPACRGRSVTVAPSLRCWLRCARERRYGMGQVWVAGPGLDHAEREVRTLHAISGGRLLAGADATTDRVLSTIDGAGTVHIAAHGRFRDDQPLLSCLDMADGPLYGYDLDRLRRGPTTVVLSACEVGRSVVSRGNELCGMAMVLLGRGTATVIASILPVPDARTAEVMVSLHSALRRGLAPAAALADAQAAHGESGFLCLGHGGR